MFRYSMLFVLLLMPPRALLLLPVARHAAYTPDITLMLPCRCFAMASRCVFCCFTRYCRYAMLLLRATRHAQLDAAIADARYLRCC